MGIDCASRKSGFAVVEETNLIFHESYNTFLKPSYTDRQLAAELKNFSTRVSKIVAEYNPEIVVIERTAVFGSHQTTLMLAFFEAASMIGATKTQIFRVRTVSARGDALGRGRAGSLKKEKVVERIQKMYGQHLTEDEAEAVVFALCGIKKLS